MSGNPYSSPVGGQGMDFKGGGGGVLGFDIVQPIYAAKGWIKLLGILNIIGGVIYCLTIIGIIIGWLPIWIGVLLNKASTDIQIGVEQQSAPHVHSSLNSIGTVFTIFGILALIGLIINVLYFVFLIVIFVAAAAGGAANM